MTAAARHAPVGRGDRARPSWRAPPVLHLAFAGVILYAAFGKGFAYAGVPPLFVGEVLLAALVIAALRRSTPIPRGPAVLATAVIIAIALVQLTVEVLHPAVPLVETVRGLAPVYYAAYAFAIYALLRVSEQRVGRVPIADAVDSALARVAPWLIAVLLVLAALLLVEPATLPTWPTSGVPLLLTKSGDIAVALVLVAPVLRVPVAARSRVPAWLLVGMWCAAALLVTFRSRGALLALVVGLLVARPHAVRVAKGLLVAVSVILVLYVTGLSVEVSGREISYDAVGDAVASVLGGGSEAEIGSNYLDTTNWRADWWGAIWSDVVDERMLVHGHGWGDNLALRHGVIPSVAADDPRALRLPHNVFFSLAGRAGVVVAVAFLAVGVLTVAATFRRRPGRPPPSTAVVAARGAVAAAVTTGLTDIYLESPQGGILFWSLIGFLWWATAPEVAP